MAAAQREPGLLTEDRALPGRCPVAATPGGPAREIDGPAPAEPIKDLWIIV
jgi:hypothetical protein